MGDKNAEWLGKVRMIVKKPKPAIFIMLIALAIISCIRPIYPAEQYLQHLGTLILLFILFNDLKKGKLSLFAYSTFSAFILIHIVGARYIYSYVPYDKWISAITGVINCPPITIQGRNHYDRFVHLASGVLLFPVLYETLAPGKNLPNRFVVMITWFTIQAIGMLYEIFEWTLTLILSTEAANDYNGQQGDLWDAQKDMFLALAGSTIMACIYLAFKKNKDFGKK